MHIDWLSESQYFWILIGIYFFLNLFVYTIETHWNGYRLNVANNRKQNEPKQKETISESTMCQGTVKMPQSLIGWAVRTVLQQTYIHSETFEKALHYDYSFVSFASSLM